MITLNLSTLESCLNGIEEAEKKYPKTPYDGAFEEELRIDNEISGLLEMASTYLWSIKKSYDKLSEKEKEDLPAELVSEWSKKWKRYYDLDKKYNHLRPENLN